MKLKLKMEGDVSRVRKRNLKPFFWCAEAGALQSATQRQNAARLIAQWLARAVLAKSKAKQAA